MNTRRNLFSVKEPYVHVLFLPLAVYLIFIYLLTLNPFRFSLHYLHQFLQFRLGLIHSIIGKLSWYDILLNLLMFVPVGSILGVYWRLDGATMRRAALAGTGLGFLSSASIEIAQLFLPRTFSIFDIFTNSLGAGIGVMLAFSIQKQRLQCWLQTMYFKKTQFYWWLIIVYSSFTTVVLLVPCYFNHFGNWNESYQLFIGNEKTMNRPWQGAVQKISIFNKALSTAKIETLYQTDPTLNTPADHAAGLLAEYIFNSAPVINRGFLGQDLELLPWRDSCIHDNSNPAILADDRDVFRTAKPASRLTRFLKDANRLSVVIWLKPTTLQQTGPARIISLSEDCDNRNFTLGQSGSMLNFRVRTPLTGNNGNRVSLHSDPVLQTSAIQCVAATYHRGEMRLYHNSRQAPGIVYDTSPYLPLLIGLREDKFGKLIFCLFLLYPLGWFARGLSHHRTTKYLLSSAIIFLPFLASSTIKVLHFRHRLDLPLLFAVIAAAMFVAVSGFLFDLLKNRYSAIRENQ
ncbi:MAG: LamG-like jellyroll fold domain-containing protein [Candidatus Zhuqueibacterota bacterium]